MNATTNLYQSPYEAPPFPRHHDHHDVTQETQQQQQQPRVELPVQQPHVAQLPRQQYDQYEQQPQQQQYNLVPSAPYGSNHAVAALTGAFGTTTTTIPPPTQFAGWAPPANAIVAPYTETEYRQDHGPINASSGAPLWMTVGGILGLSAAAAVRWLNGGDFQLFPPPTISNKPANQVAEPERPELVIGQTLDGHDDNDQEVPPNHNNSQKHSDRTLQEGMAALSAQLHSQGSRHDELLQRLVHQQERERTNQSMDMLRGEFLEGRHDHTANRDNGGPSTSRNGVAAIQGGPVPSNEKVKAIELELTHLYNYLVLLESNLPETREWGGRLHKVIDELRQFRAVAVGGGADDARAAPSEFSVDTAFTVETSQPPDPGSWNANPIAATRSAVSLLLDAVERLVRNNDEAARRAACQLLYLYVVNLSSHLHMPRYRKIFTTNESYQKVQQLDGGRELLEAVGFVDQGSFLEWLPNCSSEPTGASNDNSNNSHAQQEREYLGLLKGAAAALSLLKSPAPAQTSDLLDLCMAAVTREYQSSMDEPPQSSSG